MTRSGADLRSGCAADDRVRSGVDGVDAVVSIAGFDMISGTAASNGALVIVKLKPWAERTERIQHSRAIVGKLYFATLGIPEAVVSQLVDLLGWRLDFKADVHRGDRLRVLWEQRTTLAGRLLRPGHIVAVEYEGRSDSAADRKSVV